MRPGPGAPAAREQQRAHAGGVRALHVGTRLVADVQRLPGIDSERREGGGKRPRIRLGRPDAGRVHDCVDERREPDRLEHARQRDVPVRDDREPQAAPAQAAQSASASA